MKVFFKKIFSPAQDLVNINLLRKILFIYIVISFIQLLPFITELYSSNFSIIFQRELSVITLSSIVNLLAFDSLKNAYWWFFGTQIIFSVIGFFGYFIRLSTFIVWFTTINLQNRIYSTNTGGDLLLNILLFYLIFISDRKKLSNQNTNEIINLIDNVFIFLCKFQVLIVYAVSAFYKLNNTEWLNGSALENILSVKEYSTPFFIENGHKYSNLLKIFTWFSVAYQIVFVLFIFARKYSVFFLLVGVMIHLFIAFFIGLFNFSFVMICCYLLFISNDDINKMVFFLKKKA